ncbi:hypothetical protein [Actinomycetospora sp. NBRC 106378]|jgi:hypothetical protein|uniref:hypothetical protein n=1 Tax=Actinomycetospora sp. NBRC 106378 TaxID=3032208 RepID=UPI0024A35239|nr:hypothetical protein [Actinomycetospora sp. NBRC 106378]GLZ55024.1 hypothetical protein Acsp07_46410 [Actinomycetospora sp. NBRC 106378]
MRRRRLVAGCVLAGALLLAGCGGGADDAAAPAIDPAVKPYCDTVVRVQAEQTSPQAGQGGVPAASAVARKQVDDLVATAPPELAADWRTVSDLTDRALGSLAATRGDPNRIDRAQLAALEQRSLPAVQRIKDVTAARCHVEFRPSA